MNILVTGGGGYLGGRISVFLKGQGYFVKIITSKNDIANKEQYSGIEVFNINFEDEYEINKATSNIDVIIHCAGSNSDFSEKYSFNAAKFTGLGTYNLMKSAIYNSVKYFYYFSTYHIYSNPLSEIIEENSGLYNYHPYAITHRIAEDFILMALKNNLIKGGIIRLSNSFGSPVLWDLDSWKLVINDMCKQAILLRTIKIKSNINLERNFISINKIEKFIDYELKNLYFFNEYPQIVNLGYERNYSLIQIAIIIKDKCQILFNDDVTIEHGQNDNSVTEGFCFKSNVFIKSDFKYIENIENDINDFLIEIRRNYLKNETD